MKTFPRHFGLAATLAWLLPLAAQAQQEPIIDVRITKIGVESGTGSVIAANVTTSGSGYSAAPVVTVSGGGGSGAAMTALMGGGAVTGLKITNAGTGYTSFPTITIAAPGVAATATATTNAGAVSIALATGGSGYASAPKVTISGNGTGAAATATVSNGVVTALTLDNPGTGYSGTPTVTIAPPGTAATAEVQSLGAVFLNPIQNESYGSVGTKMNITAEASGTFGIYTYTFFVNGVQLAPSSPVPAASWAPPQPGSYLLTVTASDGLHTATSLAVRYFATGTAIVGPVDKTLVPIGSSVVLQATATPPPSGANAFVQRMDFYVDNVLVGSDSTYPYSYIYTPAATPTTHVIEARGFDNNGNQISPNGTAQRELRMVTPIGTPPSVRIVNPLDSGNVAAGVPVNIIADAVAPDGFIKNVDFYVNGVLIGSTQKFPFSSAWTPQVPGSYELLVIGQDDKSNAVSSTPITVEVTGAFPTVSITSPDRSGMTVVQGTILPVRVSAAGPDGGISSLKTIEFLVNGVVSDTLPKAPSPSALLPDAPVLTEPFVFNWKSSVAVGTHRLAARVTGVNGLSVTSSEVTVNVVVNQAPRVELTSPTASSTVVMNSATTLVAAPTDVDGTVELVEFFADGTRIGSATKSPFQISWTPTATGAVELKAKATDNGGATAMSEVVTINVDPPASSGSSQPTVSYSVYRGDYGSATESGRFTLAVSRNNRGTLVAFSTAPAGRSYFWSDIPINTDGSFAVRDSDNQVVLSGQTSATGVSGIMNGRTFIGPITPATGAFSPLMVSGTLTGVSNSRVVAIVGGDGSVTIYSAVGNNREVGSALLSGTGTYGFSAPTGGRISGTVANSASIVSGTVSGGVAGNFLLRLQASRISNISTRTLAGSGDKTLVAGFVVGGTGTKPLLIRAVGPTLANFGVANALLDPDLSVLSRTSAPVASNNDWGNSAALAALAAQVGAFPLTPGSRDAAAQVSLTPGTYTAVVGGGTTVPGSALIEIYDVENPGAVTARITNISTRGQIGSGDALIAGFVITGDVRKRVLIRAVGPTLGAFGLTGVLADPKIDVLADTTVIASNNDWTDRAVSAQVAATGSAVGAFPLAANSKDAALVLQLTPGTYTVQVSGVGALTGAVLVEIYDADL